MAVRMTLVGRENHPGGQIDVDAVAVVDIKTQLRGQEIGEGIGHAGLQGLTRDDD